MLVAALILRRPTTELAPVAEIAPSADPLVELASRLDALATQVDALAEGANADAPAGTSRAAASGPGEAPQVRPADPTTGPAAPDLVARLAAIEARLAALEAQTPTGTVAGQSVEQLRARLRELGNDVEDGDYRKSMTPDGLARGSAAGWDVSPLWREKAAVLRALLAVDGKSEDAVVYLGILTAVLTAARQYSDAEGMLVTHGPAVGLAPWQVACARAALAEAMDRHDAEVGRLREALAAGPPTERERADIRWRVAWALAQAGRTSDALAEFQAIESRYFTSTDAGLRHFGWDASVQAAHLLVGASRPDDARMVLAAAISKLEAAGEEAKLSLQQARYLLADIERRARQAR